LIKELTIKDRESGIQKVTLDVGAFYFDEKQRGQFEKKFFQFSDSDCVHSKIIDTYSKEG